MCFVASTGEQRRKARFPVAYGFVGKCIASGQKHLHQIAQTEFVAEPPLHDQHHDVGWVVHVIERRSRSLIEHGFAAVAAENPIA